MPDLSHISDADLQAEPGRREQARKDANKPQMLDNPDFSKVIAYCKDYMDAFNQTGRSSDTIALDIFVASLKAVFGENVYEWIDRAKQ